MPVRPTAIIRALLVAVVAAALAGCAAPGASPNSSPGSTVKIGVADAAEPYWQVFVRKAKEHSIDVELVNFTDYNQPNPALAQGQLQLNQFQHLQYLANYNVRNHDNLVPIGATAVYPLPMYSRKHRAPAEIPTGGQVAIPNDPTNQARALLVLQAAKLITLRAGGTTLSSPSDIDPTISKVTVVPVDAAQTAANLPSVDAAVVNNNYATAAGLGDNDILFTDDPNSDASKPYINVFVARAADRDNPTYRELVAVYHDPEVEAAIRHDLGANTVFKENDPAELQSITAGLAQTIAKAVG